MVGGEQWGSDLEATLMDVVELQAEGLDAADDASLVADQAHPYTSDVAGRLGTQRSEGLVRKRSLLYLETIPGGT